MEDKKFRARKALGIEGEDFFQLRHNELLRNPVVLLHKMDDWNVEGADFSGERLLWEKVWLDESGQVKACRTPYLQYGGIEVKALGEDQFLPRYRIDDLQCGTLGFPLYGKTEDKENGGTEYCRDDFGNLQRWMEPSVSNRGAKPIILAHLLQTKYTDMSTGEERSRFFASIIFEDFEMLLQRINQCFLRAGIDLTDWEKSIPVGEKAKGFRIEGLYLQGNMVHIPLSELADLATVTMIGNDPDTYDKSRCSKAVQQARLNYLKELAGDRWIPQEKQGDNVVTDAELLHLWHQKLVWGRVRYSGLLNKQGEPIES